MDTAPLVEALYAIGIGLLVGLEREHSEVAGELAAGDIPADHPKPDVRHTPMGARTNALLGLTGWLLAYLSGDLPWLVPIGVAAVVVLIGAQMWIGREVGMTTEVAGVVVVLLGVLVHHDKGLAVALALGTTALLVSKSWTRGLVVHLRRVEITATLQLLLLVAIVLPLVPVEPQDPWGALPPRKVVTFIVLIAGVQYVGYVLTRWLGAARGIGLAGLVGGLTSSTAVTVSMARAARADAEMVVPGQLATLLANTVMPIRVVVIAGAISPAVGWRVGVALVAMTLTLLVAALLTWRRLTSQPPAEAATIKLRNPFELWGALGWGLVLCGVLLAAHLATEWFGDSGFLIAAAVSGITDVDAITLAAAERGNDASMAAEIAALAIVIAVAVNTVVKATMAVAGGGRAFGVRIAVVLGISVAVTVGFAIGGLLVG